MPCLWDSTFAVQLGTNLVQETTEFRVRGVRDFIGARAHDCCFLQAVLEESFLHLIRLTTTLCPQSFSRSPREGLNSPSLLIWKSHLGVTQ